MSNNLRGKIARVTVYRTGTGIVKRRYIGKVVKIHTARNIRDDTYFSIADRRGNIIDIELEAIGEYATIDYLRNKW